MVRKKKNPVTDMPVIEVTPDLQDTSRLIVEPETSEEFPILHEPGSHGGIFDGIAEKTKNNLVSISSNTHTVRNSQVWRDIDSVLSDVVNFV